MLPVAGGLRPRLLSEGARIGRWQVALKHGDLARGGKKNGKKLGVGLGKLTISSSGIVLLTVGPTEKKRLKNGLRKKLLTDSFGDSF